jgi:hypothetical protein
MTMSIAIFITGCTSQPAVEQEPRENAAAREFNCQTIDDFVLTFPDKSVRKNWNNYDNWEYFEENLWVKLDVADEPSFEKMMELRRLSYSNSLYEPPKLGSVITYDPSTETNNAVKIEDFASDAEKITGIEAVAGYCPGFNSNWWEDDLIYP